MRGSDVPAPALPLGQRVEGSLGRRLVRKGPDQAGSNGADPTPAAHEVVSAEQRRLKGKRIEPPGSIRRMWTRSGRGRAIGRCCQPGNEKGNPACTRLR